MTQIIKYSPSKQQFFQTLPDDCIDLTLDAAQQVQSALSAGLPFVIKADNAVSVAPSVRHKYFAKLERWIDFVYQYSASTGACYPSDMLDQYTDLPKDLQPVTADVYAEVMAARDKGLPFLIQDGGERVNVAPSIAHGWDAKKGDWVLSQAKQAELDKQAAAAAFEQAKATKNTEINTQAQAYIDHATGADQLPAFEVQGWAIQGAEAKAWHTDPTAPTPTLDAIAKARGLPLDALRAGAYKKTMLFESLVAAVTGQRQKYNDQLRAAKTVEAVNAIVVAYGA